MALSGVGVGSDEGVGVGLAKTEVVNRTIRNI